MERKLSLEIEELEERIAPGVPTLLTVTPPGGGVGTTEQPVPTTADGGLARAASNPRTPVSIEPGMDPC